MRFFIITVFVLFSLFGRSENNPIWFEDFQYAQKKALEEDKYILLLFTGSDWCSPCLRLEKVLFESDEFNEFYKDKFVLFKADFPRKRRNKLPSDLEKQNDELAAKYNRNGMFPMVLILKADGEAVGLMRHPKKTASEYIESFEYILKKNNPNFYRKDTLLMGSAFSITAVHSDYYLAKKAVNSAVNEIVRIEKLISSWDNNSQTSLINKNAGIKQVKVDAGLFELIKRAKKVSKLTNGKFDISVACLSDVWNFSSSFTKLPDSNLLNSYVDLINYENIILFEKESAVYLKKARMKIGFGAIGKGYAADKAKELMLKMGIENGLVNAAGDLNAWGFSPDSSVWKIGIINPLKKDEIVSYLEINNMSIVTSGNYEKFVEINGERYSHIIDPQTAWPVSGLASVSIISNSAELSDALATAVFVMGAKDGLELINKMKNIEAILFTDKGALLTSDGVNINLIKNE
jgi:thiamine biosynthesis lipoprotein